MEIIRPSKDCVEIVVRAINKNPHHWHNAIAIIKVISGTVRVRTWAVDSSMNEGDYIVLNIGEVYEIEGITEDNMVLTIYIDALYCSKILDNFNNMYFLCNSIKYKNHHPQKYFMLEKHMNNLTEALISNKEKYHYTRELIKYLSEQFDFVTGGKKLKKFSSKVIERNTKIYELIRVVNSPYYNMPLKDISADLGVSYSHLRKDINSRYGYGFKYIKYAYMTQKAVKYILLTDESLINIVYSCGFSDSKYMIRYFKTFYGCTPSEFRKLHKGKYLQNLSVKEYDIRYLSQKLTKTHI